MSTRKYAAFTGYQAGQVLQQIQDKHLFKTSPRYLIQTVSFFISNLKTPLTGGLFRLRHFSAVGILVPLHIETVTSTAWPSAKAFPFTQILAVVCPMSTPSDHFDWLC